MFTLTWLSVPTEVLLVMVDEGFAPVCLDEFLVFLTLIDFPGATRNHTKILN